MSRSRRYWAWLAVVYASVLAIAGALVAVPGVAADEEERERYYAALSHAAPALVYAALIVLFVCAGAVGWAFRHYPRATHQLADQTRTILAGNTNEVVSAGGPELGELARAINQLADSHRRLEHDLDARSREARARIEEERDRLAILISELTEGVVMCNADGRILLYNARAAELLGPSTAAEAQCALPPLGLARSVFGLIDRNQIAHALDKIQQLRERGSDRPSASLVTTAANGSLLRVRIAPFLSEERGIAGMVLTLDDVGGLLGREGQRIGLLAAFGTRLRAPVANLRAAAESLVAVPDMDPVQRERFVDILASESRSISETIDAALREYGDALKDALTLDDMRLVDLLSVVQRKIDASTGSRTTLAQVDDALWVKVDSYALAQALASVAARLREEYAVVELELRGAAEGRFARIDLAWRGAHVDGDTLVRWETEPMRTGAGEAPLTLIGVLERHGGEAWSQIDRSKDEAWFRLLVPLGEPVRVASHPSSPGPRPEHYDFDLFKHVDTVGPLAERRLRDLSFTVFDTETTGLEPSAGDEIVSIGGVRIVNGRLLRTEVFDQLVNPQRPIARDATRIHGIGRRALADAPPISRVLRAFHRFCEDTVLVAHNAAFDMRFLELKEDSAGVRFTRAVLDTLLLSAVVHSSFDSHHLDAIAERLGVRVIGRHTALGDALVTGEVFLKLIPLLAGRGIVTLGQAIEASRETYHARLQY